MRNANRFAACLFLVWAFGVGSASAVTLIFQNNSDLPVTNPVLRYGTQAQFDADGAGQGGLINFVGTAAAFGGQIIVTSVSDSTYQNSPPSTYTRRWGRTATTGNYANQNTEFAFDEAVLGTVTFHFWPAPEGCPHFITLQNTSLMVQKAYWMLNNEVIYAEELAPGHSRSHVLYPEDCDEFTVDAFTVSIFLSEDFELLPNTNLWFFSDDGLFPTGTTNDVQAPFAPPVQMDGQTQADPLNPNAPIFFSPAATTNTTIATMQGTAGIITSQQAYDQMSHQLLNAIRTNTQNTAEGLSAVAAATTNLLFNATNRMSDEDLQTFTEAQETMSLAQAAALGEELEAALDAMEAPGATGGGPLTETIAFGSGPFSYSMNLGLASWAPSAGIMSAMKAAFTWLIVLVLFSKQFVLVWQAAVNIMQVPQGTTAGTSVVGTNINASSAVIMAGIICGVIVVAPVLLAAQWDRSWEATNPVNTMASISTVMAHGAYYANQMFPIGVLLTALASYFTFRFFALSTTIVQALIIRLLVGL